MSLFIAFLHTYIYIFEHIWIFSYSYFTGGKSKWYHLILKGNNEITVFIFSQSAMLLKTMSLIFFLHYFGSNFKTCLRSNYYNCSLFMKTKKNHSCLFRLFQFKLFIMFYTLWNVHCYLGYLNLYVTSSMIFSKLIFFSLSIFYGLLKAK